MKKKEKFRLKKVHLESLISVLMQVYENGIDFIDLVAFPNGCQDLIRIEVKESYYCTEEQIQLTDEIIRDIIA